MTNNKKVFVCFDFEGRWGMPFNSKYNINLSTQKILQVLSKYKVKAIFLIVGKIIEVHPEIIKMISSKGHEIGLHGYNHEHLDTLDSVQLKTFEKNINRAEKLLLKLTGKKPRIFRSPYLMGPTFYTKELYKILETHGYKIVSNRELRFADELFRPDRINIPSLWGANNVFTKALNCGLNFPYLICDCLENKTISIIKNFKWFASGARPFYRDNLLEVPTYSPLDCDLLGLPKPSVESPENWIDYSTKVLVGGAKRTGDLYNLNFHDWIIGSTNRIKVLDGVLANLSHNKNIKFIRSSELN